MHTTNIRHTTTTRRVLQAVATLAAGAVMAVGAAATANAAEPPTASSVATTVVATDPGAAMTSSTPSSATVDASRLGEIAIHKFREPSAPATIPRNGSEQDTGSLVPIPGVGYDVHQVAPSTFDLTTNAGWDALSTLTPERAATMSRGYGVKVTTDAQGNAAASNLPLGVYLVTEQNVPGGGTPISPFLVTVPMTDPVDLDSWLYTVNVYPKGVVPEPPVVRPSSTPVPSTRSTPGTAIVSGGPYQWPGVSVHTGGAAAAVAKWAGHYWASATALLAALAAAAVGFVVTRRRQLRRVR